MKFNIINTTSVIRKLSIIPCFLFPFLTAESVLASDDQTEFFRAVCDADTEQVIRLLKLGVDPNKTKGNQNISPLIENIWGTELREGEGSCSPSHEIVKILLNAGADPNHRIMIYGYEKISVITMAARSHDIPQKEKLAIIKALWEHGADLNATTAQTHDKASLLLLAVEHNDYELAKFLLEKGFSPNTKNRFGDSPVIHAAQHHNDTKLLKLLVQYQADLNARKIASSETEKKNTNKTALMFAVENSRLTNVVILLTNDADPNIQSTDGSTALTEILAAIRLYENKILRNDTESSIKTKEKQRLIALHLVAFGASPMSLNTTDFETYKTIFHHFSLNNQPEYPILSRTGSGFGYRKQIGDIIIAHEYESATPFNEGLAAVLKDGAWRYIDPEGKTIIQLDKGLRGLPFEGEIARVYKNGKASLIDRQGVVLVDELDVVDRFAEGLAVYEISYKKGYVDNRGKMITPAEFDDAFPFENGFGVVRKNAKYGFIDTTGNVVVPIEWDSLESFSEGLAAVKKDGLWGYVDERGKIVIKPQFFGLYSRFEDGRAEVNTCYDDDCLAVINHQGQIISH